MITTHEGGSGSFRWSSRRGDESDSNRTLAQAIKQQLVNCIGYEGDELSQMRKQSYDYYFQRARGDEIPGRSEIVSGDLSSMVEGNLAQMVEPLIDKRIAEFCAYSPEDEEQAQLESECVTEMLFKRQNGFIEVTSAAKDALMVRNGVVKVYVDKRKHTQYVRRGEVAPEIVTMVLDKIGKTDVHKYDPETGELSATVTKETKKFRVECIAPENFLMPKDWHRQDLEGIPFCAERHVETRATLIERGFPKSKVAQLRRWNNPHQVVSDARLPRNVTPHSFPLDKSQEKVEWYECYALMDDGTGASELRRICIGANQSVILEDEPADLVCYSIGACIINPHTWMGISLFDKLKSVQDASTALNRALQDNLNATNKNRTAHLDGVVEEADLTDGRINGSIRVKPGLVNDVRAAVAAFAVPDTSANILQNIEHMRRVRSEMGGASLDMATGQMQLNDRLGSQGLDRAYSVMEALARFMTRVMAHTLIRSMYLVAHETLRTQWQGVIQFKRGKTWVKQDPSTWMPRESVKVNLGASSAERARLSAVLDSVLAKQATLAQAGMEDILVDVVSFYNAAIQWLRINDVDTPEQYFLDPRSPQGVQAFKQREQSRQLAQQKQEAMVNQAIALEQLRVAFEKYRTDSELQWKYYDTVLKAQIEEAKLSSDAVVKITEAREAARAAMETGKNDTSRKASGGGKAAKQPASEGNSRQGRE